MCFPTRDSRAHSSGRRRTTRSYRAWPVDRPSRGEGPTSASGHPAHPHISRRDTRDRQKTTRIRRDRRSSEMPPKRRAPARGAGKKAADATGDRDILVIEVIEGPAKGTKFTPTVRIHGTHRADLHPPPSPVPPLPPEKSSRPDVHFPPPPLVKPRPIRFRWDGRGPARSTSRATPR